MAGRMVEILDNDDSLEMFAVGLAHWTIGPKSLEILLAEEGYTLERVEGAYDPELLPNAVSCPSGVSSVWQSSALLTAGLGAALWFSLF